MAEVLWSVICRKGIVDKFTNQASLIDVIEAIEMTEFAKPTPISNQQMTGMIFGMTLAALFRRTDPRTPERPKCRVRILAPDGSEISASPDVPLDLEKSSRTRYFITIPTFKPRGSGTYEFHLQIRPEDKTNGNDTRWETIGISYLEATVKTDAPSPTEPMQPS